MSWNSVSNAHHYDVRIRAQGSGSWTLISNIPTTTRTKTGLSSSTVYEWQVRSACSSDSSSVSSWSSSELFTTQTPCTKPQNLNVSGITLSEATLGWDAIPGAWGYRIRYKQVGSSWTFDTSNTNSLSLTGLSTSTQYQWQVKGICDSLGTNTSNWTSNQIFVTASCNSLSLNATATNAICDGGSDGSIDLSVSGASGSYTYLWSNGSTLDDPTGLSAGTYTVVVTDSWGCVDSLSVVVGDGSAITSTNPQTICPGGSYIINGNTYTSAGSYQDIYTSVNGCDSTVTTVITIGAGPSVSLSPTGPVTICNGSTRTLTSSVTNTNYTYVWSDANGVISGATSSTYNVSVTGTYTLTITSPAGCSSTSNSVVVNVISVSTPTGLVTSSVLSLIHI